jgi:hypothetical protein
LTFSFARSKTAGAFERLEKLNVKKIEARLTSEFRYDPLEDEGQ